MGKRRVPAKAPNVCTWGTACPYVKARRVHAAYLQALKDMDNSIQRARRTRLPMARFVRDVAAEAAKSDSDIWECFRRSEHGEDAATSWGTTWLHSDIRAMEESFETLQARIEERAKELIEVLEKTGANDLQQHLVDLHQHFTFESYGPYDPELVAAAEFTEWHHVHHALATLTDQLSESEAGRSFLEKTLMSGASSQGVAFKDAWGAFKKAESVRGPLGKLVYNLSPAMTMKVSGVVRKHRLTTVATVLDNADVDGMLGKLADKINVPKAALRKSIADQADVYGGRFAKIEVDELEKIVARFDDFDQRKFTLETEAAKTLDDGWWSLTLNLVSFAVSTGPMLGKLEKVSTQQLMSLVQGVAGLAEQVSKQVEASRVLREADPSTASRYARVFGATAAVLGLVLSLMEVTAAMKSGNAKKIVVAYAGALVGVGAMVATLVSASIASGVLAIVGIAIAVVAGFVLAEHPISGYLKRTPWGTEGLKAGGITVEDVVREYYRTIFDLRVRVEVNFGEPSLVIESNALTKGLPIEVTIRDEEDLFTMRRVTPGKSKVAGKGEVLCPSMFWQDLPQKGFERRVIVNRPWEVWDSIRRDGDTEHTIEVAMKLRLGETVVLRAKETDVEFP